MRTKSVKSKWANWNDFIKPSNTPKKSKEVASKSEYCKNKRFFLMSAFDGIYLTRREAQIIVVLEFHTYRQIAKYLGVSMRTIEFYVSNIRRKLHCMDRIELVGRLRKHGVVPYLLRRYPNLNVATVD